MNKEELIKLLKGNLKIQLELDDDNDMRVTLFIGDEEMCSSWANMQVFKKEE